MKRFAVALLIVISCSQSYARSFDASTDVKIDQIVSIFENSTPELQYSYVENLGDGRGYTAGRAGFTTGTGDLLLVVQKYGGTMFATLLPRLRSLARSGSGSVSGLSTLPSLWLKASDDPKFRAAQDAVSDSLYKNPARAVCARHGLKSALALLVIYDSIIQHGDGYDYDSLGGLLARTPASSDEHTFIASFLAVRRADLMNPANTSTRKEWRESVDRVDALKRLVDAGNWDLASPLRLDVWGDTYAL